MGSRITKKTFEQIIAQEIPKYFISLDFAEAAPGAFCRQRGVVRQGFGLTPNPSFSHFHVPVGVALPAIDRRIDYVDFGGRHYPTLLVSRWLGEFKGTPRRHDIYYHFSTEDELRKIAQKVYADFKEQAEPWLANLTTVESVAKCFHLSRIAPTSDREGRRPDPFAWAIYGWLLHELGQEDESRTWLQRARDHLRQPCVMKSGQFVPRTTRGLRSLSLRAEESRLLDLLEQDLSNELL